MPDDISRRRWTDDRIDDVVDEVRALRQVPTALAETRIRQENMQGELADFKTWISDVEERLTAKIDAVEQRVIKSRRDTLTAVLAFAAPITAAVVAGVVALITHFA